VQQNPFSRRSTINKTLEFIYLVGVLYAIHFPYQIFHIADKARKLQQEDALVSYAIKLNFHGDFSNFHEDIILNYDLTLKFRILII
jgi:hypothetical protein